MYVFMYVCMYCMYVCIQNELYVMSHSKCMLVLCVCCIGDILSGIWVVGVVLSGMGDMSIGSVCSESVCVW